MEHNIEHELNIILGNMTINNLRHLQQQYSVHSEFTPIFDFLFNQKRKNKRINMKEMYDYVQLWYVNMSYYEMEVLIEELLEDLN